MHWTPQAPPGPSIAGLRAQLTPESTLARHALRLAFAGTIGLLVASSIEILLVTAASPGHWDVADQRVLETVVGCALAVGLVTCCGRAGKGRACRAPWQPQTDARSVSRGRRCRS